MKSHYPEIKLQFVFSAPPSVFHHCLDIKTGSRPFCAQMLFTNIRVVTVMPLTMVRRREIF